MPEMKSFRLYVDEARRPKYLPDGRPLWLKAFLLGRDFMAGFGIIVMAWIVCGGGFQIIVNQAGPWSMIALLYGAFSLRVGYELRLRERLLPLQDANDESNEYSTDPHSDDSYVPE